MLVEAGQAQLSQEPIFQRLSTVRKLALAQAALDAHEQRDPRVLDAALEKAKSQLAWLFS
jgi:hypothetical protein